MMQHTRLWTATLAAAALMALPVSSAAQSSTTAGQSGQYEQQQSSKSPSYHLEQADKVLDRIDESSLTGTSASTVRDLKQNFEQLRTAYNNRSSSTASGSGTGTSGTGTSGTGTSGTGTSGTGTSGSGMYGSTTTDWRQSFSKIQQSLDELNVPKSSAWMPVTGTGTGTSGTSGTGTSGTGTSGTGTSGTGTSGTSTSGMSSTSIDPSVMADLKEFRRHVEEFYKAASSGTSER